MEENKNKIKRTLPKLNHEHIAVVNTRIGTLYLFATRLKDHISLKNEIGASIKEITPQEYIKNLIVFVCYPESKLGKEKYRPESYILTTAEIDKLSDEELEYIAKVYLSNNTYLFKKHETNETLSEKEEEENPNIYDVEHLKKNKESYIQYLHRLSCIAEDKDKKQMEKFSGFSTGLFRNINKNLLSGKGLIESMSKYNKSGYSQVLADAAGASSLNHAKLLTPDYAKLLADAAEPSSLNHAKLSASDYAKSLSNAAASLSSSNTIQISPPSHHLEDTLKYIRVESKKNEEILRKEHREPFDNLAQLLDKLTKFTVESNETQQEIAAEIKNSGDKTADLAKSSLRFTRIIIILTTFSLTFSTFSLVFTAFSLYQNTYPENFSNEKRPDIIILNKILTSINQSNKTLTQNQQEIDRLNSKNLKNEEQIEILNKEIEQPKNTNK
ncbi:MAG: hypothetical protein K0U15_05735 [Proteobacteria bacterium]|nr:hypothetical protein [Pseudomonadota bacterium]